MEKIEIMFREYNNLWQEKLLHKESQRKFYNYVSYMSSIASLALVFLGLSTSSFFGTTPPDNAREIVKLLCLVFPPVILLFVSFVLNDAFQLYVIAAQIGSLERRINQVAALGEVLSWQDQVCPVVFGGQAVALEEGGTITNVIWVTTGLVLAPFLILVVVASGVVGVHALWNLSNLQILAACYFIVVSYFVGQLVRAGLAYRRITKADSPLLAMLRQKENQELAQAAKAGKGVVDPNQDKT